MIVTILGGNSQSTPALLESLDSLQLPLDLKVRLAGRDKTRLHAVGRACRILTPRIHVDLFGPEEWSSSLAGSDVVLVQLRIGGQRGREWDENRAKRFGSPADEGLGLGGFSCAARTWPELKAVLALVRRHAGSALTLLLTSPASLLVRLASYAWPDWRLYGICELPFTTLREVCRVTHQDMDAVAFGYTGVNHLGFLHSISADGLDIVDAYTNVESIPFRSVVREWSAIPLKYLRLHFERAAVLEAQAKECRGRILARLQDEAMGVYTTGDRSDIGRALKSRPAPWYEHAVAPFIAALAGYGKEHPFFLTTLERDGLVQERPFKVGPGTLEPLLHTKGPPQVEALTTAFVEYEREAAHAIWNWDPQKMERALAMHPWTNGSRMGDFVTEILDARNETVKADTSGGTTCLS